MMAAMMLPAVSPTVALYARMAQGRWRAAPLVFTLGYLLVWGAMGLVAYAIFEAGRELLGAQLAWDSGGRWFAGGILVLAAVYEVTPLKDVCLAKCRTPLGFLLGSWRDGNRGALEMGARHGAWCVGCCWLLMASLFALGAMSLTWMAVVAALITVEKTLPGGRAVTWSVAGVLLVMGIVIMADPGALPGLTVPGDGPMPDAMPMMS
jgi:predicted metal-binding membrane protein